MIPPTKDEQLHGRDKGRVLLVSDDGEAAPLISALERAGLVVVGVTGGAAALVALRRKRPHVVVVSLNLQGISGEEFSSSLNRSADRIPYLLIGGLAATAARREKAIAWGAFDYLEFPGELSLITARVIQLVEIRQSTERLKAEADRDYLTGLSNRRRFRTALGQELERWRRYRQPCSLLIADLDHLKVVNDTYGHSAGDVAIRHVASLLTEFSRDNDTAARLGGEEFALLLAGTDARNAVVAADRLRQRVSAEILETIGRVTISIGVASCPTHAGDERSLYAATDSALYRAKREGRDRVCVADAVEPNGTSGKIQGSTSTS